MEIELKLLIEAEAVPAFRRLQLLKQLATAPAKTRLLHNTYFDTPELTLHDQGLELRVRRVGRLSLQTLKARGKAVAGLHERPEWETRVSGTQPELESLLALVGAGSRCGKALRAPGLAQALQPVFVSEVRRTVWPLRLREGAEVELALDRGALSCGKRQQPISEVELELKAGSAGALFELALQLQAQVPLRVGNISKSARGYALLRPMPVVGVKASAVELAKDLTLEQGFGAIVGNCLAQMQANEFGVLHGADPESIHQMRVGLRRLRCALRLFVRWMPLPPPLLEELEWLGEELGAARDAEVLAGDTLGRLIDACPLEAGLPGLQRVAWSMARRERRRAAAAVESARHSRLMLELAAWVQALRWRESGDEAALAALAEFAAPLAPRAAQILRRRHRKLIEWGQRLADGTPEDRHRVRIAAKKARYAAEFFQALLAPRQVKRYLQRLTGLQDALGWLNDVAVAEGLLADIAQRQPALADAAAFARGYLAAAVQRDARAVAKLWRKLEARDPP